MSFTNILDPITDRATGMVYGLAIGDSLGAPYEFYNITPKVEYTGRIPKDEFTIQFQYASRKHRGGWVTDDTQMTIALLDTLYNECKKGKKGYNREKVIQAYLEWANGDVPIGRNTREHFKGIKTLRGFEGRLAKFEEKERSEGSESSQSNGSLMRCSVLSLLDNWKEVCLVDCNLTNRNPVNRDCSLYLVSLLRGRIFGLEEKYQPQTPEVKKAIEDANDGEVRKLNGKDKGWVVHALYCALYIDKKAKTLEEGLDLIHTTFGDGCDLDTIMSVTGALIGSRLGLQGIMKEKKSWFNLRLVFERNFPLFENLGGKLEALTEEISLPLDG